MVPGVKITWDNGQQIYVVTDLKSRQLAYVYNGIGNLHGIRALAMVTGPSWNPTLMNPPE